MILKKIVAFVLVAGLPAAQMFAYGYHSKRDVKMLNESAAALNSINPELSGKLRSYATEEQAENKAPKGEKVEMTEAAQADEIKTVRDSAAALDSARPDLAKKLRKFADKEEKREQKRTTK